MGKVVNVVKLVNHLLGAKGDGGGMEIEGWVNCWGVG